jgi:hypothetical protein
MQEASATPLAAWESFYVMLGSAAAVLTGLVFVVITLLPDVRPQQSSESLEAGVAVFSTSTIVHFCAVLFVCAVLIAPWQELSNAALLLGLAGLGGMAYTLLTIRRLRRRRDEFYETIFEDWLWYTIAPLVGYTALVITAVLLPNHPRRALFGIGAVGLLLLFLGLRNVWDSVTYMALQRLQRQSERQD